MYFEVELQLGGGGGGVDAEERDEATRHLRSELLSADILDVQAVHDPYPAPPGSKGFDPARIGELAVTIAQFPEALNRLVDTVRNWLGHARRDYSVRLVLDGDELVVGGVSAEVQQQLIDVFLSAHAARTRQSEREPERD